MKKLIVLNEKIKKRNGDLQPVSYENAHAAVGDGFLIITHDGAHGRQTTKIPIANVVAIIEDA